jgi:hypothetical protein
MASAVKPRCARKRCCFARSSRMRQARRTACARPRAPGRVHRRAARRPRRRHDGSSRWVPSSCSMRRNP